MKSENALEIHHREPENPCGQVQQSGLGQDGSEDDVDVPEDRRLGLQTGGERILLGLQERPLI